MLTVPIASPKASMTKTRRVLLATYCLLLAYCFLRVPWSISYRNSISQRVGYGWIWAGPDHNDKHGDIFDQVAAKDYASSVPWERARPDVELIAMRLIALTAVCGASFVLTAFVEQRSKEKST
jgi:hypothetical protein